ncbi:MAG: quinone oxidoreductase [Sphingomonadales bacterium 35-56-22]|uniref:quinone oxidoreductase family protein n=1 Tax=Sphingorhabdus sp. TaxID=1902408 RepID=UPI000BC9D7B2|nr:quinone oxidoreductase [Sphingorhabdus sp.]OYY15252.1 MAG: quinone oxidoreductase [Sphingomonadales bacterium 35-56-22]OYY97927.1 MAG: quinone oxidoreductase [Sphingomonadales bacterium 28-56-43]OYZ61203.1 MAG: quinone oxidoreductase [Sphingomonadales bacterium 24-56-14]OZA83154.1 MAG: quinone oxidoreductase [Sphingomonadales bacterium 39-57-19]HQS12480.1 quinone oxidoreductase [Sphingorhabdus sp.]
MERAAQIRQTGGPDVIAWTDVELAAPGPGEVRMRNLAVGLNFIDTYHRGGLYPMALPSGLGMEAAGIIEAVGDGVTDWRVGDRVATFGPSIGAYATARNIAAHGLFLVPDDISDEIAAAGLLKGCTTEFLVERCAKVQPKWDILVHAAAGGVGLLLVQWLKHVGARVIGTVSTDEKAALARAAGADHVILNGKEDVAAQVRELTGGKGVEVTFDGVGRDTWETSLNATARRGLIVSYGNASGPVTGVNLGTLAQKGSLYVSRPTLFDYYHNAAERAAGAEYVFDMFRQGIIDITIRHRYALEDAAQAHRDLEGRKTVGSSILIP